MVLRSFSVWLNHIIKPLLTYISYLVFPKEPVVLQTSKIKRPLLYGPLHNSSPSYTKLYILLLKTFVVLVIPYVIFQTTVK